MENEELECENSCNIQGFKQMPNMETRPYFEHNTLEYKAATPEATAKCIEFRKMCLDMQEWITKNTNNSRSRSVALTELETLNMWTNKAIIFSNY